MIHIPTDKETHLDEFISLAKRVLDSPIVEENEKEEWSEERYS